MQPGVMLRYGFVVIAILLPGFTSSYLFLDHDTLLIVSILIDNYKASRNFFYDCKTKIYDRYHKQNVYIVNLKITSSSVTDAITCYSCSQYAPDEKCTSISVRN